MFTCIVSAYFKIQSKKPHEWYLPHLIRFFKNITENVVFFTTQDVIDEIKLYVNVENILFVITNFKDINAFKNFETGFWEKQYSRDTERYHSPELGAIWYNKKEFVIKAMDIIQTDVYIWCDAGCVRDEISSYNIPLLGKRGYNLNDDRIHLQKVNEQALKRFYTFPDFRIACAIIVGNKKAWIQYKQLYDIVLKEYDDNSICSISDQNITCSCIDRFPNFFKLYSQDSKINEWFKFLEIL